MRNQIKFYMILIEIYMIFILMTNYIYLLRYTFLLFQTICSLTLVFYVLYSFAWFIFKLQNGNFIHIFTEQLFSVVVSVKNKLLLLFTRNIDLLFLIDRQLYGNVSREKFLLLFCTRTRAIHAIKMRSMLR